MNKVSAPDAPEEAARPITAVVLAGGQGRRFQGRDKGLLELERRALADWVVSRVRAQVSEVLINANRNLDAYARLGYPIVADRRGDAAGPLAGLSAAARTARHTWLLALPCDTPFLPAGLAGLLYAHALSTGAPLVRAANESGTHYAVMLMHRDLADDLDAYLRAGERTVRDWQARHRCETLYFGEDPYAFLNINTQDELRAAERLAPRYRQPALANLARASQA